MKKIFCISILFLLLVGFSSIVFAEDCTDSDNGKDYYVKGITKGLNNYGEFDEVEDSCYGDILWEYVCVEDMIVKTSEDCKYGCKNGVCITCVDSDDGEDIYEKGKVIDVQDGVEHINEDECVLYYDTPIPDGAGQIVSRTVDECEGDKCKLMEQICIWDNTAASGKEVSCPNGCKDGACIQIECTDSDGGKDYYEKGVTKGKNNYGEYDEVEDSCYGEILWEYICVGDIIVKNTETCTYGCKNGACAYKDSDEDSTSLPTFKIELVEVSDTKATLRVSRSLESDEYYYANCYESLDTSKVVQAFSYDSEKIIVENLKPETKYFCRVILTEDGLTKQDSSNDVEFKTKERVCVDSDKGKSYFVKGSIEAGNLPGFVEGDGLPGGKFTSSKVYDTCTGMNWDNGLLGSVQEFYCENGLARYEIHGCSNGCEDGACLPFIEEDEEIEIPEDEPESSKECPQKSCIVKSEKCAGKDKIILKQCKVYIEKGGECQEITTTNSEIKKNACTEEALTVCQGCQLNEKTCIPFGTRLSKENIPYYCGINNEIKKQKDNRESCQNSYECISNNCKGNLCSPICEGCLNENNVCIPIGTRTETQYCDIDYNFKNQKSEDMTCNNNYECSSNICVNNKCISPSFIQKIIDWFSKLFGG